MDYNARYYSPVLGRFVSPDTMIQEPGQGRGFNRYRYARNNPLKYTDPSGHFIETVWDVANVAIGVGSMAYNLSQGNYTDAAIDAGGLVVDVAATIVPGVPGGASAAIKAIRAGDKGADVLRYATKAEDVIDGARMVENAGEASRTYGKVRRGTPNKAAKDYVQNDLTGGCIYCGKTASKYSAEHVVPVDEIVGMPGFEKLTIKQQNEVLNNSANLQRACRSCNSSRQNTPYSEWSGSKKPDMSTEKMKELNEMYDTAKNDLQKQIDDFLN